jgi:hypothetical protein
MPDGPCGGVSKSFRTGRLERELQMVQLSATRCSCITFMSQSSEFCRHNPLCCLSTSNVKGKRIFRYQLGPEIFGYTLICPTGWESVFMHPLHGTNNTNNEKI